MEIEQLMDQIDLILQTSKAGTMTTSTHHDSNTRYMTFYIKDYTLYTETEKDSPVLKDIARNLFVHITLGGDKESEHYLEITGETEVVTELAIIDWLAQEKELLTVASDMVMLKVMAQKVKMVGSRVRIDSLLPKTRTLIFPLLILSL